MIKYFGNEDYFYNVLGIEKPDSRRLKYLFNHIRSNKVKGDIMEFGVYGGASLIAIALILKEIGSKKKIYGFDSFSGFPSFTVEDDLKNFEKYSYNNNYKNPKLFSKTFLSERIKYLDCLNFTRKNKNFTKNNISSSGNFDNTNLSLLKSKIKKLKLNNIVLVKGDYIKTIPKFFKNNKTKISAVNIDCDLYMSYKIVLNNIYPNLNKKAYVHLDEYYSFKFPGAKIACNEFFTEFKIKPKKNMTGLKEFERWYFTK